MPATGAEEELAAKHVEHINELQEKTGKRHHFKDSLKDLCAGTVAGMVSKVIEYPLDTIKVRQQVEKNLGALSCLRKTLQLEGVRGLFKGLSAPMAGAMAENAIIFFIYARTKALLDPNNEYTHKDPPLYQNLVAGAVAGFGVAFWLTPVEFVKNYTRSGWREFFKGNKYTVHRETIGGPLYFGFYEAACGLLTPEGKTKKDLHPVAYMAAGGLGGACYWTGIFPYDTVKSRIQTGRISSRVSMFRAFVDFYRIEGFRAMYSGLGVTLIRSVPSNAVIFGTYEMMTRTLAPY